MGKRILVTSTDLMMIQFLVPHIKNLAENGYEVEIACSEVGGRFYEVCEALKECTKAIHQVRLCRSPVQLKNLLGFKDMKQVINHEHFDIIWTNEPVMSVVTRLSARQSRKKGTKVLYMVHGFHFFKGAPKKYWLAFYPVEKLMIHFTDIICTVNIEDYKRAKKMGARDVRYIHGIGINTDRLTHGEYQNNIREELGIAQDAFLVLSVGELNVNKNQKVIIDAIYQMKDPKVHYVLCGKGDQLANLQKKVTEYGIEKQIHFLGYRTDVIDICSQSDVYVMPSHREGLPVSSLEAMYCGLPLITSNIRGLVDIMKNGVTGYMFEPDDAEHFCKAIQYLKENPKERYEMGKYNQTFVRPFCISQTKKEVLELLRSM